MMKIFLLFTSAVTLASTQIINYRLPDNVKPISYDLLISSDLENFNGTVSIILEALEPTTSITLHSKDLHISDVRFTSIPPNSNIEIAGYSSMSKADFFSITLSDFMIVNENYMLEMDFSGTLGSEEHKGFYKSTYQDENDTLRVIATTNFKPTNARRVFPCFDQPDFKATFSLRIVRDRNFRTSSNTYLQAGLPWEWDSSKTLDVYTRTPVMSTYLLAFTISDFAVVYSGTYSVYGRKQLLDLGEGEYALRFAEDAVHAMEDYTQIDSDFIRLVQFAVPNEYFEFDAIENWAMITYRERYLMFHSDTSTTVDKLTTATTIARAMAHQWFGNIVTPRWWNDIWLNEGIATYLELIIINEVEPAWKAMDKFLTLVLQPAFYDDAFSSTIPVSKVVESPTEIENLLYHTVLNNKAASIIRMTEGFLGNFPFKYGLMQYLRNWSYNNVEAANLYTSWQEAIYNNEYLNVTEFLQMWVTRKGYPVVTVSRNYNAETITFRQKKFLLTEPLDDPNLRWPIPFNLMYSIKDDFNFTSTLPDMWLTSLSTTFIDESPESFVIANKGVTGYYRVNYDVTNWNNIIAFLIEDDFSLIPIVNRAQLLDDAFNLARAGELSYEIPLQLSTYLIREREFVPLMSFFNAAKYLNTMLASHDDYLYFKAYIEWLLNLISLELNFEDATPDSQNQRLNRINALNWLCDVAGGECRQKSLDSFRKWKTGEVQSLKPDSQLYIYCGALREGDQSDWDFLFQKYRDDNSDAHRERILNALGCSENTQILTRVLDMTLEPDSGFLSDADRQTAFASVYNSGGIGLNVSFDYVKSKYGEIYSRSLNLNTIIIDLSTRLSTEEQLAEFNTLLQNMSDIITENTRAIARRNAEINVFWSTTNVPIISEWLKQFLAEDPEASSTTIETTTDGGIIVGVSFEISVLFLVMVIYL